MSEVTDIREPRRHRCRVSQALAFLVALVVALAVAPSSTLAAPPTTFATYGTQAGQLDDPYSAAIDQTTGTVYIGEINGARIDEFNLAGDFQKAFGFGVLNGANTMQTCTTVCRQGLKETDPGAVRPEGIAIDPTSHDIYAVDRNNYRIEKFTPSGEFLLAFGKGVDQGPHHPGDVCKAAYVAEGDKCGAGSHGAAAGQLDTKEQFPLAVDSSGDVWVGGSDRLERFGPEGEYLSQISLPGFGNLVGLLTDLDPASPAYEDFYALNEGVDEFQSIQPPASGTYTLSFEGQTTKALPAKASAAEITSALSDLSTIGAGNVSVAGSSGTAVMFQGKLSGRDLPQLESSGALITTERQGVQPKVSQLSAGGTVLQTLDEDGHPAALGIDPASGRLFVSDQTSPGNVVQGPAGFLVYEPDGTLVKSFGTGAVIGSPRGDALAYSPVDESLYVASSSGNPSTTAAQIFTLPEPGPLPEENGTSAKEVGKTSATLSSNLNPEGKPTTVHFQYVDQHSFETEGGFASPHTHLSAESGSVGEDFAEHPAAVAISGLEPETTYHFRLVAHNEDGTVVGEGATLRTLPPFLIDSVFATEVRQGSATLGAQVNPLGDPATYRFEYLAEAEFLEDGESFSGPRAPAVAPIPDGVIAPGPGDVTVSERITGLLPGTAYRYRVTVTSALRPAGVSSPVRRLLTEGPSAATTLLDGRAWEMVSPLDKNGGAISGIDQGTYLILVQAAADGGAIAYGSPVAFADPAGSPAGNQYLSVRHGEAGWSTENIGIPTNAETGLSLDDPPYKAFSTDLVGGLLSGGSGRHTSGEQLAVPTPPLPGTEAAAGFGNFYLRTAGPSYRAILTEAGLEAEEARLPLRYEAATPDLGRVVFFEESARHGLLEWSEGRLTPLNLLPGKTSPTNSSEGLGNGAAGGLGDLHALSADGARAVWAAAASPSAFLPRHNLYLRENIGQEPVPNNKCSEPQRACTIQIDASEGGEAEGGNGTFLAASADDSAIFFADNRRLTPDSTADQLSGASTQLGDLYRFAPDAEAGHRLSDLTVDHTDPGGAEVLGVLGASGDGSYLYFVANGVLAANAGADGGQASHGTCRSGTAVPGATCNLYLYHAGQVIFIAALAGADREVQSDVISLGAGEGAGSGSWAGVGFRNARLSADGTSLLFTSYRALTGYDNIAANGTHCGSGEGGEALAPACPEVFRYAAPSGSAPAGRLACLSCNPSGARPLGLSGVPTATRTTNHEAEGLYQSRALSSDGARAFFDSYDALVPQDTNGRLDVYEWEEAGEGTCVESSPAYSPSSQGCVSLISSGTAAENSAFMDASEDGSDVFFITGSSLVKSDPGSVDLYDARVDGGLPEPPPPLASCSGDACQSPPPAPNDPTPASSAYEGPGNEAPPKPCPKGKVRKGGKCVAKHHRKKPQKKKGNQAGAKRGGAK